MKFQNKVAVVTGSTKGIGRATALLMAEEGAKVVVVGTTEEAGNAVAAQIREAGGEAIFQRTDVTCGQALDVVSKIKPFIYISENAAKN